VGSDTAAIKAALRGNSRQRLRPRRASNDEAVRPGTAGSECGRSAAAGGGGTYLRGHRLILTRAATMTKIMTKPLLHMCNMLFMESMSEQLQPSEIAVSYGSFGTWAPNGSTGS
jgi:hypothetical protein